MNHRPYTSSTYRESSVVAKYIGYIGDELIMFEVNDKSQTLKSYPINPADVAEEFADKAKERQYTAFNQVKVWTRH